MKFSRRALGFGALLCILAALAVPAQIHALDPNNFSVRSFDADYYLSRDVGKRSRLNIIETIGVQFPPFAQNHGIERAIPQEYDGHSVHLTLSSVKDEKGRSLTHTTYNSNHNTVVRIGDPDKYVEGLQTYVINYQLQDVTKNFGDHDEIFWDTNGTDWGQTFGSVTARLHLSGDIAKAYTQRVACYEGVEKSTSKCVASVLQKDNETILTFKSSRLLYAGENVSYVAGFKPGTFAKYQPTTWERIYHWLLLSWFALGAIVLVVAISKMLKAWREIGRSPAGRGTIVPEYIPPKDLSVLASSAILKRKGSDITAQIIDLSVRHYLKIYETDTRGNWFRSKRSYELEIVRKLTGLKSEEKRLVDILFGEDQLVGRRITLEQLRSRLYKDTAQLEKEVEAQVRIQGYLADLSAVRKGYYIWGGLLLAGGFAVLNPGVAAAGFIIAISANAFHPLTGKGVERRDYLRGLEMYMKLAEAERLRYLQSPQGAVKTRVSPNNTKRLVTLYERLLPYAIVFGLEKDWVKQFALLYDQPPEWYVGNWSAFNAAVFASSLSSFSAASNTVFTPPSSSSSSGFSGGGSSGGGGGGGGGGGW